jgi:hypothetical protein
MSSHRRIRRTDSRARELSPAGGLAAALRRAWAAAFCWPLDNQNGTEHARHS